VNDDFQSRLLPGERIAWTGSPATGLLLTGRDALMIPFSLFWCGFIMFWEWGAMHAVDSMPWFPLFGIPFVLVGLYMLVGRLVFDAWVRSATQYAVTNQRVLILRAFPIFKFTALAIDRLPQLSLEERADGRGTIRFEQQAPLWSNRGWSTWTPALDSMPQFLMIADASNVFDRIQKLGAKSGT
jgi:hypothetical protein